MQILKPAEKKQKFMYSSGLQKDGKRNAMIR